jgi:uncharacterized protein YidB (DUF937 family)
VSSWISTRPNPPISATEVTEVPVVVDQLTPKGSVPATNNLESALGGLLAGLGK